MDITLSLIITVVIAVYALVVTLKNMIQARKRSWFMAAVRLGVTVVAAGFAFSITREVADLAADTVYGYLLPHLGEELAGFLNEVPVGAEGMRVIASLAVAPLLFVIIFVLLRWAASIVLWVVEKCIPLLKRRSLRILSTPMGILNGLLVVAVTLLPLCGYLVFGSHLLNTFVDSGLTETSLVQKNVLERFELTEKDLETLSDEIESNPIISQVYMPVGEPLFTKLTTAELDASETHGQAIEMNLERELKDLLVTAAYAIDAGEAFSKDDYSLTDKKLLFTAADSLFDSEWVRLVATDSLVAMSETWLENKSFAGLARPTLDASLNPTVNRLLEVLSAENAQTLEEDIHVILDVVGDLKINGLLEKNADYTAMVKKMGESGLLTDMLAKLEENERLQVLASELKALSIRLVSNMLGVDKLASGEYSEMMGNVAGALTDSLSMNESERDALILDAVKNNYAEYGFDVPDEVALKMSHEMIDELGADGEITGDESTEYMVKFADEGFEITPDMIPDGLPEGAPETNS
jgi:hypothetical protein